MPLTGQTWTTAARRDRDCYFLRRETDQSSHFTPVTRPNRAILNVTSVAPRRRACAAIKTSYAPIGLPATSSSARTFRRWNQPRAFHILGSKLNGSDGRTVSVAKSACVGLRMKCRSDGMTTDGTDKIADVDSRSHLSPNIERAGGAGYTRQS